jgi:hypothetical protein
MSTSSAERAARRIWKLSIDAIAGRTDAIYSEEVIAAIIREELARCPNCGLTVIPMECLNPVCIRARSSGEPK